VNGILIAEPEIFARTTRVFQSQTPVIPHHAAQTQNALCYHLAILSAAVFPHTYQSQTQLLVVAVSVRQIANAEVTTSVRATSVSLGRIPVNQLHVDLILSAMLTDRVTQFVPVCQTFLHPLIQLLAAPRLRLELHPQIHASQVLVDLTPSVIQTGWVILSVNAWLVTSPNQIL